MTLANHRVPSLAHASGYDKTRNIKVWRPWLQVHRLAVLMLRVFAQRTNRSPTRERGAALSTLNGAFELLAVGSFQRREQRVTLANHQVPSRANASGYDKTRNIKTTASGYHVPLRQDSQHRNMSPANDFSSSG